MKKLVSIIAVGLACATALPSAAQAQADASNAQADLAARLAASAKLIEVMHLDKQLDAIMPQFIDLMMSSLIRGNTGREEQVRQILGEEFNAAINTQKPAFMQLYRDIYARNFTLAELEGMTAFYATPVGQSVLAKTPKMTQDSMQSGAAIGQRAAQQAIPNILKRMQAAQLEVPQGT